MPDLNAGASYGALIADQLSEERSRKSTLEARGIAVISSSGVLVTLLLALIASVTATTKFRLPGPARLPVLLALVAFISAAICGLMTNVPLRYKEPTVSGLVKLLSANYWAGSAEIGQLRVAEALVTTLAAARSANALKVYFLLSAIFFELLAVIFLSWAAAGIIYGT